MRPKTMAPIGRVMSARPTVSAMSGRVLPNAVATSWMTNVRTKKSKASSVHPRNPARTALRWFARSSAPAVGGVERFMCGELYCRMPDAPPARSTRQPVHTVYGGAHLFTPDTAAKLGAIAMKALGEHAPNAASLAGALGMDASLAARFYPRIVAK